MESASLKFLQIPGFIYHFSILDFAQGLCVTLRKNITKDRDALTLDVFFLIPLNQLVHSEAVFASSDVSSLNFGPAKCKNEGKNKAISRSPWYSGEFKIMNTILGFFFRFRQHLQRDQ